MPDSDSLYHRLFAHPHMVEGLVREFVPERLVADLDFSRLQRVNPKFHPSRRSARRREADVIWRAPIREGGNSHLYLLVEFQSEIDRWMAVRTQVYQSLLWQQVIDEHRLKTGTRLPPLLLLVVYNGERRWKAATRARELIALSPDSTLWPWQPHGRYYLCDIGAYPRDKLARHSSLVALLFRLERRHSTIELKELLDEVIGWFRRHKGYERLRRLFTELIREALARHRVRLRGSSNLLEMNSMKSMLTIDNRAWHAQLLAEGVTKGVAKGKAEGLAEGVAKGIAKGKAEGLVEGKSEALICLLTERFGAVAPSQQKRIRGARLVTLERWFKRAIVAPSLHSVFNPPR